MIIFETTLSKCIKVELVHKSFDKAVRNILHAFQDVLFLFTGTDVITFFGKIVGFLAMAFFLSWREFLTLGEHWILGNWTSNTESL